MQLAAYTLCELLPDLRQATSVMLVTKYALISLTVQRLISCGELLFLTLCIALCVTLPDLQSPASIHPQSFSLISCLLHACWPSSCGAISSGPCLVYLLFWPGLPDAVSVQSGSLLHSMQCEAHLQP